MVEVRNVSKSYGKKRVLESVSMEASAGEIVALAGRNGSGKTTLLQIMAGEVSPSGGSVSFFGKDIKGIKDRTGVCSYLPQGDPLIPEVSVQDNISLWTGRYGRPDDELIRMFDLKDMLKEKAGKLSGGMRRRVALACAMACWPPVLLLDEPTASLDIYFKKDIRDILERFRDMKGTVIMSTHDSDELMMCDRIMFLEKGRIAEKKKGELIS